MQLKRLKYSLVILIVVSFLCCTTEVKKMEVSSAKKYAWMSDSFNHTIWTDFTYDQYFVRKTWMTEIDTGYDSIYIRLWYHDSDTAALQVIEIKKPKQSEWSCGYSVIQPDSTNLDIRSFKRTFVMRYPKSGWNNFTDSLFKYNVTGLRPENDIPNYESMTDGNSVNVEVAIGKSYRLYKLQYLRANAKIRDAENMQNIIDLISRELGVTPFSEI